MKWSVQHLVDMPHGACVLVSNKYRQIGVHRTLLSYYAKLSRIFAESLSVARVVPYKRALSYTDVNRIILLFKKMTCHEANDRELISDRIDDMTEGIQ